MTMTLAAGFKPMIYAIPVQRVVSRTVIQNWLATQQSFTLIKDGGSIQAGPRAWHVRACNFNKAAGQHVRKWW